MSLYFFISLPVVMADLRKRKAGKEPKDPSTSAGSADGEKERVPSKKAVKVREYPGSFVLQQLFWNIKYEIQYEVNKILMDITNFAFPKLISCNSVVVAGRCSRSIGRALAQQVRCLRFESWSRLHIFP